jgi:CheY-like chemotaxis protein
MLTIPVAATGRRDCRVKQILVVDDELVIREVLSALFTGEGYAVLTAGDGLAALDTLADASPDLVIADIIMPRLDGWALLQRLRAERPELPVVLLSATFRGNPPDGVVFVAKPFDIDHLLAVVARMIDP